MIDQRLAEQIQALSSFVASLQQQINLLQVEVASLKAASQQADGATTTSHR